MNLAVVLAWPFHVAKLSLPILCLHGHCIPACQAVRLTPAAGSTDSFVSVPTRRTNQALLEEYKSSRRGTCAGKSPTSPAFGPHIIASFTLAKQGFDCCTANQLQPLKAATMESLPFDIYYIIFKQAEEFDGPLRDDPALTEESVKTILMMRLVNRTFHRAGIVSFVRVISNRSFALTPTDMGILEKIATNELWVTKIRSLRFSGTFFSRSNETLVARTILGSTDLYERKKGSNQAILDFQALCERNKAYRNDNGDARDLARILPLFTSLENIHVLPMVFFDLLGSGSFRRRYARRLAVVAQRNTGQLTQAISDNQHDIKKFLTSAMSLMHRGPKMLVLRYDLIEPYFPSHSQFPPYSVPQSTTVTTLVIEEVCPLWEYPLPLDKRLQYIEEALPALQTFRRLYPGKMRTDGYKMEIIYNKSAAGKLVAEISTMYQKEQWEEAVFPTLGIECKPFYLEDTIKELRMNVPFDSIKSVEDFTTNLIDHPWFIFNPHNLQRLYIEESSEPCIPQRFFDTFRRKMAFTPDEHPAERIYIRCAAGDYELWTGRVGGHGLPTWIPDRIDLWQLLGRLSGCLDLQLRSLGVDLYLRARARVDIVTAGMAFGECLVNPTALQEALFTTPGSN
ncbi:uncharacterized protein K452DRAFT_311960 [Aplosporella prunicola CBS 121167]|uniref:F-box domain-containing protein n=1 Tax=Aplosporella prunicola CBS 121167 TaxID=1176127 RepID=A0A6A6B0W2_9PEZI|nr:uncharacterized protein K452DRAFT_311960 [Aplosporella prunicola CBS 121167]KAF2137822.1 hypothetical protein K452DRAFT_311960 [Aplosporella prunicola CBS 121167]